MFQVKAKTRTVIGKQNQTLRQQGLIPAVVYGHKIKNQNLELDGPSFLKVYGQAGETNLISLDIENQKPFKVIVQDIAKEPLKGSILHVDFHQIREDEEITVDVHLEIVGESPAVKELNGILVKSLDEIKIECLPGDLIHKIEIDISGLTNFGDVIYVKDLNIPVKVKVLESPDSAIVSVAAPRTDKELEELKEKPAETVLPEVAKEPEKVVEGEGAKEPDKKPAENS